MPLFETLFELPSGGCSIERIRADMDAAGFQATLVSKEEQKFPSVIVDRPGSEFSQADAFAQDCLSFLPEGSQIKSKRLAARIDSMAPVDLDELLAALGPL